MYTYIYMYNFKVVILLPWFYIEELNLCQLSIRNYQLLKKLFIMENFKHRQKIERIMWWAPLYSLAIFNIYWSMASIIPSIPLFTSLHSSPLIHWLFWSKSQTGYHFVQDLRVFSWLRFVCSDITSVKCLSS